GRVGGELANGLALYQLLVEGGYGYMPPTGPSNNARNASELLQRHGVPGLKYLDGSSRKAGAGRSNFVIWDEALLSTQAAAIEPLYSRDGSLEGLFDPVSQKAFLIAENLSPQTAPGTLMHEVGIHMAANQEMQPLLQRAHQLVRNRGSDPFLARVHSRM